MLSKYYEDGLVTLYHGDCREYLATGPTFDVAFTDPPYGMRYRSQSSRFGPIFGDDQYDTETLVRLIRLARCGVFAFGRWNNLKEMPTPRSVIAWVKNNHGMGDCRREYARKWELCAFYPGPDHAWARGRPKDVAEFARVSANRMLHPTEKPLALCKKLLGDVLCESVLDPYAGSGTTLLAAKSMGKRSVGIEIDERYCEVAAKRLAVA